MPKVQGVQKICSAANARDCRKEYNMSNKITILYERLSVDDGNNGESNSIQNQRRILEEYAVQNGMIPYVHIADDGVSGTRWDRPGWIQVMDEIEAGNVANLVVKNLDRMGRDYLRVGLHMERFRELGVRLIAIGDGIDTDKGEDDFAPFRAIMAEWMAKDCSKKIRAVLHAKGKSGKPMTTTIPYGYMKSPDDKTKWLIDPEAAAVVRRIFEMTIDGMGPRVIATKLHNEKVERPSYYLAKHGHAYHLSCRNEEHKYSWADSSVAHILEKLDYAGHTVNFKGTTPSYKSKKRVQNPQEDWLIFRNTHEAIITEQQWELVQKLRQTKRRTDTLGEANPLTGLLFCGTCGGKMYNNRSPRKRTHKKGDKTYTYTTQQSLYICSTYCQSRKKYNAKCSAHQIQAHTVEQVILELLREGEWSEGIHLESGRPKGKRTQKIEVYLKYVGSLDVPCSRTPEEIEAERLALEQERRERRLQYGREWRRKQKEKAEAEKKIS